MSIRARKRHPYIHKPKLRKMGWKVVRVWEHELKDPSQVVTKLLRHLSA
jgi:hypothetical protein